MEFKDCYRVLGVVEKTAARRIARSLLPPRLLAELTADLIEAVALLRRRLHTHGGA
jgi:hypothetical protein